MIYAVKQQVFRITLHNVKLYFKLIVNTSNTNYFQYFRKVCQAEKGRKPAFLKSSLKDKQLFTWRAFMKTEEQHQACIHVKSRH